MAASHPSLRDLPFRKAGSPRKGDRRMAAVILGSSRRTSKSGRSAGREKARAMRCLLLALGMIAVLADGTLAASAPRDTLIVPGMRVGPIALGMTPDELNASVGVAGTQRQEGTATLYSWGELSAQIGQSPATVDTIVVNDGRYETTDHIHVGLASL